MRYDRFLHVSWASLYLRKREALIQYPVFRRESWPMGSGMVESANKNVVEARLKGPGMHWQCNHVNPMLALRNAVCNDRWKEMWQKALKHHGSWLYKPCSHKLVFKALLYSFALQAA